MPALPSPGQLRHPLVIEAITGATRDETGGAVPIWTPVATRWARIETKGGEGISISQASTRATLGHAEISFRFLSGLNVNWRIRRGAIPGPGYSSLTAAQMEALLAVDLGAMPAISKKLRVYAIAAIMELDDKKAWHQVNAVEVASG